MNRILRHAFFLLIVRPLVLVGLGLNVRHGERLRHHGQCIIVANHNSHLDTLVLMTLLPHGRLDNLHPVAAADYFLSKKWLAWIALGLIGILPLHRDGSEKKDPLARVSAALSAGKTIILFPEGTRGEAERLSGFKRGIAHLARRHPDIPVIPVFLHGLGKILPRHEFIPVPFVCDVFVGEAIAEAGDIARFMNHLEEAMSRLAAQAHLPPWE